MPAYVSLFNFTAQGIQGAKDIVKRADAVRKAAEAAGGRVIGVWWLMGQYDGILIAEAADDAAAARLLLATGMQGNVSTTSMRAFSEEEMTKIVGSLP